MTALASRIDAAQLPAAPDGARCAVGDVERLLTRAAGERER